MNEKFKIILLCIGIYAVSVALAFAVGFWRGRTDIRTGGNDSERIERYEERSESAQNVVSGLEDGLGTVAEQMHGVGSKIESGITDVGELNSVGARIAGASTDIAESAGRIEERIQRIESILSEAEEKSIVLEECGDCIDPGGGY